LLKTNAFDTEPQRQLTLYVVDVEPSGSSPTSLPTNVRTVAATVRDELLYWINVQ